MKLRAWAIGEMDHGVDGRSGDPTFVAKRVYDSEEEAREHVFDPFIVKEIEVDVNEEMDRLKQLVGPKVAHVLRQYRGDIIQGHLLGKVRLGGTEDEVEQK